MKTTLKLTVASIKMFIRNKQALFFTIFMPFFIMLVLGYIGFDKPQKMDVGIVSRSYNPATTQFVEQIRNFPTFTIHEGTLDEEKALLDNGDLAVILDIPSDFVSAQKKSIDTYLNAGKAIESRAVVTILNEFLNQLTFTTQKVTKLVSLNEISVNTNNLRYIDFLLPGLIAMSVMQMSVFSVAFVFTEYKSKGVLKRLLATPMKPYQFVAANGITRLLVALMQTSIFIIASLILFKIHIVGSYGLLLLCVILGALMFLGLGFTISGISKTVESVPAFANLIVFPMLFLGGIFFSVSNMPSWLQHIAKVLPITFFSTAMREVMTKGATFGDIKMNILGMFIWGVILMTLATFAFRFQEKDSA